MTNYVVTDKDIIERGLLSNSLFCKFFVIDIIDNFRMDGNVNIRIDGEIYFKLNDMRTTKLKYCYSHIFRSYEIESESFMTYISHDIDAKILDKLHTSVNELSQGQFENIYSIEIINKKRHTGDI